MSAEIRHGRHRTPRRRLRLGIAAAVSAVCLIVGGIVVINEIPHSEATVADLNGNPVQVDEDQVPTVSQKQAMRAVSSTGERFAIPAVGLDVQLGEVSAVDGSVVPPGFTSVYRVRNRGVSLAQAGTGTVYLVTHSVRGGGLAPGNYVEDPATGTSTLTPGTAILVGDQRYEVTTTQTIPKDQMASNTPTWANVPNRLVLITCLQNKHGTPSTHNLVITAVRTTGG
ncbi:class F sortase [Leifsonia sp. NPDC077715]|uniref:class F sortase n=1 Tax=Leifsonia sp. NPDC077715 TaxID=3155539 RepID=UPI00343FC435